MSITDFDLDIRNYIDLIETNFLKNTMAIGREMLGKMCDKYGQEKVLDAINTRLKQKGAMG